MLEGRLQLGSAAGYMGIWFRTLRGLARQSWGATGASVSLVHLCALSCLCSLLPSSAPTFPAQDSPEL